MKYLLIAVVIAAFAWSSNDDYNCYQALHNHNHGETK